MALNQPVQTIGVVGAGTMGSGIALAALFAGFEVVLQDPFPESLTKAHAYLEKFLKKKDQADRLAAVKLTGELADLAGCDLVIEAALEEITLKREIFAQLEAVCRPDAVLASNTSTLSVTAIAAGAQHPGRIAGMHFFNPAPVLPLVEIVRAAETSDAAVAILVAAAERLGKTPVQTRDTPGFIVNRVARPFYGEALRLMGEGAADFAEIDRILRMAAGFKLGPFQLMDLIGVDINATAMMSLYEQTFQEPRYRPHWIQIQQMASGNLGRKTGRGFYDYRAEQTGVLPDETPAAAGGRGAVLFYAGRWDHGLENLLHASGYHPEAYPQDAESLKAVIVAQAADEALAAELEKLDWLLPEHVPVFVQVLDATLDAQLPLAPVSGRFVGFDPLFLASGRAATLVAGPGLTPAVRAAAEGFIHSLGRLPIWVADTPALIAPRVVCMLANEAAFAVMDGVAEAEKIDLAMKLGVSYPNGPIEWGRSLGWVRVLAVLEHLYDEYGEDRYRACRLIRRWAHAEQRTEAARSERRDPWDA